ncbi:nucleotidyl transferase AbiEii/AbiGii toxin family protein [Aeromicrobium sp. 636]|uniref:Nucleotidyl transferase AbiEii/AbiGii toxin family protein n=1 Tax=Aeromicrobium senzhongii TaxID=2663859 RepID=A0A8I0ETU2_9ACTN|nr:MULTISPECIES: nucleotidyl transferase AbiEii/AbiGii toxin family protein [Aeromicrobium]MBC9226321.1 nucleotidyl transferase AbiEii/AbiGii toxin family protein [Aeromicrobium senzhongii]MCQ3998426.1 nucleotidyl transferase AbiEii/AbiGii toxin family protein [Aeromicrobium sp. 636]
MTESTDPPALTDEARVAEQFGVGTAQVERDKLISHILAALSKLPDDQMTFFGGTALSRTHLPDLRLSEDIDLIALWRRADVANDIDRVVSRALARAYGEVAWLPELTNTRGSEPAVLQVAGLQVQVQLVDGTGYPAWPTEVVSLYQRYEGVPAAAMRVPTIAAFAASKLAVWCDRFAERDLYDLWALAQRGAVTTEAVDLFVKHGPTGLVPTPRMFETAPTEDAWETALGHQCVIKAGPDEALAVVRDAWLTRA